MSRNIARYISATALEYNFNINYFTSIQVDRKSTLPARLAPH